jgi:hypothetical protein
MVEVGRVEACLAEICFGVGEPFQDKPIVPTLFQLSELVYGIWQALEAQVQAG